MRESIVHVPVRFVSRLPDGHLLLNGGKLRPYLTPLCSLRRGLATESGIQGCTEEEVAHIEQECDVTLPTVYRSFLAHLGRSSGEFLRGYVAHYPRVLTLQDRAQRFLQREDGTDTESGEYDFVFAESQGVTFFYFDTTDPDPPVYVFAEGHGPPEQFTETFSQWMFDTIERYS